MNVVCLIGRLGKDPELRVTQGGTSVAKFSLAVDRRDEAKNTDWFDVTCFGKVAESTGQYMKKGCLVGVTGRIQIDKYTDKEGKPRKATTVIASQVDFLSRASESNQAAQNTQQEDYGNEPF